MQTPIPTASAIFQVCPIGMKRVLSRVTSITPLGSTTALLQRRPDILAAEQKIVSANAEVGVAVANFFPKIGLSAFVGGQAVRGDLAASLRGLT